MVLCVCVCVFVWKRVCVWVSVYVCVWKWASLTQGYHGQACFQSFVVSLARFLLFSQAAESEAAMSMKISHCITFLYFFYFFFIIFFFFLFRGIKVKFTAVIISGIVAWPEVWKAFWHFFAAFPLHGGQLAPGDRSNKFTLPLWRLMNWTAGMMRPS